MSSKMDLQKYEGLLKVVGIGVGVGIVKFLASREPFKFLTVLRRIAVSVFIGLFASELYLHYFEDDKWLNTVVILTAFFSDDLLVGLTKAGKEIKKDPRSILDFLKKFIGRG